MNAELTIVLALLVAAVAMFVLNKPRMDAVALIMLTVLPFTGVISMGEALAGFSDPNIVLIAALFVIGEGLVRTGVAQRLGDWLTAKAGKSETRLLVLLMLAVGMLGSIMSSTGVIAIFIPVALRIAQSTGMAPSRLMMPMSVAALISGMMTLVGTAPNLVVNSELMRSGAEGFRFFSFTPFGVPILVLGIGYMLFARRWLAAKSDDGNLATGRPSLRDWVRGLQTGRPRASGSGDERVVAGRQDHQGTRPAQHLRREHRRHRTPSAGFPAKSSARPRTRNCRPTTFCWWICLRRTYRSKRSGRSMPWKSCRSVAITLPTARRRSAWRKSCWVRIRIWPARRSSSPDSAAATG